MIRQFRRIEFYPGTAEDEPPAPAAITNAFALISHGDNEHHFLQISGIGVNDDEARSYPGMNFTQIEQAKEYIKGLSKNAGLKYVSMLLE